MEYFEAGRESRTLSEANIWEFGCMDHRSTTNGSDSTFISAGGIYRTLSEPVLDTSFGGASLPEITLQTSLQLQLGSIRPSKHYVSNVSAMIAEMTTALQTYMSEVTSLVPFGSLASNLSLDGSAVDILVFIPPEQFHAMFSHAPAAASAVSSPKNHLHSDIPVGNVKEYELRQSMRRALLRVSEILTVFCGLCQQKVSSVAPVSSITANSRVPVLTMTDPVSGLRYEFTCNNMFSLFGTRLLKSYNSLVPGGEVRDFILLVKQWARRRNLVGTAPGQLTGFIWSLLCVFYCQSCLGLLPTLQGICQDRQQWTDPFGSNRRCDVGYDENYKGMNRQALSRGGLDGVSLFVGFIDFFANYWTWKHAVVSVRLGRIVNLESNEIFIKQIDHPASGPVLIVEDPFDIKKDLCQSTSGSTERIRREILDTNTVITRGGSLSSLFQAATSVNEVAALASVHTTETVKVNNRSNKRFLYKRSETCT